MSNVRDAVMAAKKRMKSGYWENVMADNSHNKPVMSEEDGRLYAKVCEIMRSGEFVADPISRIIDEAYYESLDDTERIRYVLELARKYRQMQDEYLKNAKENKRVI